LDLAVVLRTRPALCACHHVLGVDVVETGRRRLGTVVKPSLASVGWSAERIRSPSPSSHDWRYARDLADCDVVRRPTFQGLRFCPHLSHFPSGISVCRGRGGFIAFCPEYAIAGR
jgi:hypothetical protein